MSRRILGLALCVAGCTFSGGSQLGPALDAGGGDGGDGDPDAGIDAGIDAAMVSCADWGSRRFFDPCANPALFENPDAAPDLSVDGTYVIDTDDQTITDPDDDTAPLGSAQTLTDARGNTTALHLVVVGDLTIPAGVTIRAVGSRPLVLAAAGDIAIDGTIDVGSSAGDPGAGAGAIDDGACTDAATLDGDSDTSGGSGGGGGALAFSGGAGGDSVDGGTTGASGGSALPVRQMPLRGGCPGGQGGDGQGNGAGGLGGAGGGAVLVSALGQVGVDGELHAHGAGGRGQIAAGRNGGGGGGSGGLIALEGAVTTDLGARITSNGGGGGGGADESTAPDLHGADGTLDTTRAPGGDGDSNGDDPTGDGGAGGGGTTIASFAGLPGVDDTIAGGGGGGSVGLILVLTVDPDGNPVVNGTYSPLPRLDQPPYN